MLQFRLENTTKNLITQKRWFLKYQLDYIFSRNIHVENVQTANLDFSDHYPVIASFEV